MQSTFNNIISINMKPLNSEQKVARSLQKVNNVIAFLAFIPAVLCWLITMDIIINGYQKELAVFGCSSILLLVFYGYTFLSPRIYLCENYSKCGSLSYWIIILLTNLFTIFLFVFNEAWEINLIPAIPLTISLNGLIAHYNSNYKK